MKQQESLGDRIRRIRRQRGLSLAKVGKSDFSRAFLSQVELGRAQPSTRVLRVIAGRLGTEVDYLLEGGLPSVERELAFERARVLLRRSEPRRALAALEAASPTLEWPLAADMLLCQGEALRMLGQTEESDEALARARKMIGAHGDRDRLRRLHAIQRGEPFSYGQGDLESAIKTHLRLAEGALRTENSRDALEHFRAARVLLEAAKG
jgi:transcriptional regulator with XRE-family HTH domain